MRRSSAVAGVVALFVVGVAVGALGASLVDRHGMRGGPAGFSHHMMKADLYRRLDLDDAQRRQVDAIFADSHRETAALWREVRPRVEAVIARTQSRISLVLKPGQRQEFDRYCREHSEHMRQMFGRGHH
jgi:Spy/CpxP family protein refolding chaperone